jgi:hypothetical protein
MYTPPQVSSMYHHVKKLMYTVRVDEPDPKLGNMVLEQFGGANGKPAPRQRNALTPSLDWSGDRPIYGLRNGGGPSSRGADGGHRTTRGGHSPIQWRNAAPTVGMKLFNIAHFRWNQCAAIDFSK